MCWPDQNRQSANQQLKHNTDKNTKTNTNLILITGIEYSLSRYKYKVALVSFKTKGVSIALADTQIRKKSTSCHIRFIYIPIYIPEEQSLMYLHLSYISGTGCTVSLVITQSVAVLDSLASWRKSRRCLIIARLASGTARTVPWLSLPPSAPVHSASGRKSCDRPGQRFLPDTSIPHKSHTYLTVIKPLSSSLEK